MEREFIVVFGGTGTIGKHLVPLLCKKLTSREDTESTTQHVVCVVTRNVEAAIEIFTEIGLIPAGCAKSTANSFVITPNVGLGFVEGCVEQPDLLHGTLNAASRLFLLTMTSLGPRQRLVEEAILALLNTVAHSSTVLRHIVRISAQSRGMEGQPSNSPFRWHSECDDQLLQKCAFAKASGGCDIAATIIRPSLFMQDMTRRHFAPVIREEDTFYQLGKLDAAASARIGTEDHNVPMDYQDLYRIAMIDARDIAEVCACALTEPISAHANNTYIVTGPRALSWSDVAGAISNACGRGITATMLGDRAFFERFGRSHVYLKQMQAYRSGCGEDVDNDFEVVTGHRPRDIIEFARDHADAWK